MFNIKYIHVMDKIRKFLRNNLGVYVAILGLIGTAIMLLFENYYPEAETTGDIILVVLVFGVVVGGGLLHKKI